jgi:hypothetical protein
LLSASLGSVKRLPVWALLVAACAGDAPNPRAGYTLRMTLGDRFDASRVTGARVVIDSFPGGPSLKLQAGPGESTTVGAVMVTSRRTDVDGDGQVEVVYDLSPNPWASARTFDLPLRSPGYQTPPFLVRVEVLGATGILATAQVGATDDGRPLDFNLGDSVIVNLIIACVEGKSCTGDGGILDGGAPDGGADGGPADGGLAPPSTPLAIARDADDDTTEETLAILRGADGGLQTLVTATRIGGFRWSPDGTTLYVVRESGGTAELVSVAPDGGTRPILGAAALADLTVAPSGTRVAARAPDADGGAIWHVRPTDGADGGLDAPSLSSPLLDFAPDGSQVAFATAADGGASVMLSSSLSAEMRVLITVTQLTMLAFSPLGGHVAVVGTRSGETKAGLYLVSTQGDPLVRLSPDPMAGEVRDVGFSKDGQRIGFRADLNTAGAVELYVATPGLRNVSGGVAPDGGVGAWAFDPGDARRVAFLADRRFAGLPELFLTGASGVPERLSADLDGGSVSSFAFSPSGTFIAYRTSAGALHTVRSGEAPRDLGPADAFAWSPDGRWLAVARGTDLFLVSADGAQTLGPLATGLREKRFLWRPVP